MAEEYKNPDTGQEEMKDTAQIPVEDQKAEEEIQAEDCGNSDSGDTEQTAGNAEADAKAGTTDKKGFFSKNKKADKEKAGMQEKIDSLEDRVRRQMAEFDNYRKRTEKEKTAMFERTDKEKEQMFSMGERSVIEKILPIVDNFERGFDTVDESDKDDAFVIGMQKIYTQLTKQLEALGVKPIEAVGKEFDPNMHNAVMQVESQEYESGIVAQELLKGYMYHDQVLRHSMVAVVQ